MGLMATSLMKADAVEGGSHQSVHDELVDEDLTQRSAQQDYMATLAGGQSKNRDELEAGAKADATPAEKARAALAAAGLPIGHLIPDDAKSFEQKPDGTFKLSLSGKATHQFGKVQLTLSTEISGKLGDGVSDLKGVSGKKGWFSASVTRMYTDGDELVVEHMGGPTRLPVDEL